MPTERLQKILAHAGVSSRRAAERLILDGHVRVNGRVIKELGTKADPHKDRVELHGKRLVAEHPVYYLLHKPREVVTTLSDPEKRESVADLTRRIPERVFPVGRLDYHTSGALLMTNDGEMAQALLHPKKQVPKVYVAKVRGAVSIAHLGQLRTGVTLDDGHKTRPAEVFIVNEEGGNMWLQITITEGKNRQVHRMLEAVGHRVQRLFRLSFAGLSADGLRTGEFRTLTDGELAKLKRDYLNPSKKDKAETQRVARRARAELAHEAANGPTPAARGATAGEKWRPARSVPRVVREREAAELARAAPGGRVRGRVGASVQGGAARRTARTHAGGVEDDAARRKFGGNARKGAVVRGKATSGSATGARVQTQTGLNAATGTARGRRSSKGRQIGGRATAMTTEDPKDVRGGRRKRVVRRGKNKSS